MAGIQFPESARDFPLLHSAQVYSGAYSASYPVSTEDLSLGKAAGV
jgi:hypothetical protein